jgi:hypothetical protein
MTYIVQRPFAGLQPGDTLTDVHNRNVPYLLNAGIIVEAPSDDAQPTRKTARTTTKKRKD